MHHIAFICKVSFSRYLSLLKYSVANETIDFNCQFSLLDHIFIRFGFIYYKIESRGSSEAKHSCQNIYYKSTFNSQEKYYLSEEKDEIYTFLTVRNICMGYVLSSKNIRLIQNSSRLIHICRL